MNSQHAEVVDATRHIRAPAHKRRTTLGNASRRECEAALVFGRKSAVAFIEQANDGRMEKKPRVPTPHAIDDGRISFLVPNIVLPQRQAH